MHAHGSDGAHHHDDGDDSTPRVMRHAHAHHVTNVATQRATSFAEVDRMEQLFEAPERLAHMQFDRLIDQVIRPLLLSHSEPAVIADVGAGTGALTIPLAKALPAAKVFATDAEPAMVVRLTTKTQSLSNVQVVQAAMHQPASLPVKADVVVMAAVYHHIADRVNYLHALRRDVLRADGSASVVIVEYFPGDHGLAGPPDWMRVAPELVASEFVACGFTERLPRPEGWGPAIYVQVFQACG